MAAVASVKTKLGCLLRPAQANFGVQLSRMLHEDVLKGETVRIGCASGFWGDTATSVPQLVYGGKLDYLVFDYLSEITMSLLTAAKQKVPEMGYAPDFVHFALAPYLKDIHKQGIKVISNAGGVNPNSCAEALHEVAKKAGINLRIAVVTGDDLMMQREKVGHAGVTDLLTGKPLPRSVHSMNAYLGAKPICRALDHQADIVITGRCVDSAIALGPLMHKFKWKSNEFDKLAAGSLAGHLMECGAQASGGSFTDWQTVPNWENIGFPIAEFDSEGQFTICKPPKTGGLISFGTVAEQMLYEIGDPQNYLLPDVICDFSQVKINQISENVVLVNGAKGKPPTDKYKVSATYLNGYRAVAVCPVIGPYAAQKAIRTADSVIKRCQTIFSKLGFEDFTEIHTQVIGTENSYGAQSAANLKDDVREVALWFAVKHTQKKALEIFSREIAPSATGGAPGLTSLVGGRPKATPVLNLFSFLYNKDDVNVQLGINNEHVEDVAPDMFDALDDASTTAARQATDVGDVKTGSHSYKLADLAYTRSGDKGDTANIGVIARNAKFLPYLRQQLNEKSVAEYFKHLFSDEPIKCVTRYDIPGINGMNFVLLNALGGGGVASLRADPQGKGLGQMLLDFQLNNLPSLDEMKE